MVLSKDKNIKSADEKIQELLEDEQFLHGMHMRQQADWKYEGEMAAAKEKAIKEGIKEGEDSKTMEIANNLKNQGISNKQIAKATGLKIEEIKNL